MLRRILVALSAAAAIAGSAAAQQPRLVKDLSPGTGPVGSSPYSFAAASQGVLFRANGDWWRSDGTTAGTTRLKDVFQWASETPVAAFDGRVYFAATDWLHPNELWSSDGTIGGTHVVSRLAPYTGWPWVLGYLTAPNELFFLCTRFNGVPGVQSMAVQELWKTDGTDAGTTLVKQTGVPPNEPPSNLAFIGSEIVFFARGADSLPELWISDGTTSGTSAVVSSLPFTFPVSPVSAVSRAFFTGCDSAHGCELWTTDGTTAGTYLVLDAEPGPSSSIASGTSELVGLDGIVVYGATVGGSPALWRSDGTAAGTYAIANVRVGDLARVGPNAYFNSDTGLYRTDGSAAGTQQVVNQPIFNDTIASAGTSIFFLFNSSVWRYDTVSTATQQLTPAGGWTPWTLEVVEAGAQFFFSSGNGTHGLELWKSDGTAGGTAEVKNIEPDVASASPWHLTHGPGGRLAFDKGPSLWTSDGTDAGTVPVLTRPSGSLLQSAGVPGGVVFSNENELWYSDLTAAGTHALIDFAPGRPGHLTSFGDGAVFQPLETASPGLWRTDGTAAGTIQLESGWFYYRGATSDKLFFDCASGACASDGTPGGLVPLGPTPLFRPVAHQNGTFVGVWSSEVGFEPGFTDGTPHSAVVLKDIAPGVASSLPIFDSGDASIGWWVPLPAASTGTRIFFTADDHVHGSELWVTDGTTDSTQLLADLRPGALDSMPSDLTAIGNEVLFVADDGIHGRELWKTDGTTAGTVMVADINPGASGSRPSEIVRVGSWTWFRADDGVNGIELWRSDGTAANTQLVGDINAGAVDSYPLNLLPSGGTLFFSAFSDTTGRELWAVDLAPQVDALVPSSGAAAGGENVTIRGWSFAPDAIATIGTTATTSSVVDDRTITAQSPAFAPGTLHDVVVRNASTNLEGVLPNGWFADFLDVTRLHPFHNFIEKLVRNGVTAGCGGGYYCVNSTISRAQMAVFLLRGRYGSNYAPPPATGTIFADVPADAFAAAWIEEIYREGVTAGCSTTPLRYCPADPVSRESMAVLLLRMQDPSFVPPPPTGIFEDVPPSSPYAPWIEELYRRGVTGGCATNPLRYCPSSSVTRGQMAVFVVTTFALP